MNRNNLFPALASLALVTALGTASQAQTVKDKPLGVSLRGGFFLPTDQFARDSDKNWIGFGVQYKLAELELAPKLFHNEGIALSIDYYGKGDFTNVPVLLNYTFETNGFFFSAGAGAGFATAPGLNKSVFSFQGGIGYAFNPESTTPFFVEGKFFGSDHKELNGFGIYFGVKI